MILKGSTPRKAVLSIRFDLLSVVLLSVKENQEKQLPWLVLIFSSRSWQHSVVVGVHLEGAPWNLHMAKMWRTMGGSEGLETSSYPIEGAFYDCMECKTGVTFLT